MKSGVTSSYPLWGSLFLSFLSSVRKLRLSRRASARGWPVNVAENGVWKTKLLLHGTLHMQGPVFRATAIAGNR